MSVEKSIAVYQEEQAEAYEKAVQELQKRGKIDTDAVEGEKLATLAQEYTARFEHDKNHNATPLRDMVTALGLVLPFVFWIMLAIGIVVGIFLGISYVIGPIPPF